MDMEVYSMAKYTYRTKGTCSSAINFEINDGVIAKVEFLGGCNGNLQGICKLVEGKSAQDIVETLKGIKCGGKPTSCPDQLACALELALSPVHQ
jgi:uncharacterized protein (TIGR03905 family)